MTTATVLGAGVSGLTTALVLQERGFDVTILTRESPADTVSAVAAAMWYPLRGERDERVDPWLRSSYRTFLRLAADPATGIALRRVRELHRAPADDTWWRDMLPGFATTEPPRGYAAAWESWPVPVIEMPVYLAWLVRRFRRAGTIEQRSVTALAEVGGDIVVNCTGLDARALADDRDLVPIRGQVVRVEQVGVDSVVLDEQHPDGVTYVIPRAHDVVLGGVRLEGVEDRAWDPAAARSIVERCTALVPALAGARIVSRGVGLRPGRARVRLEREGRVIHNYGHGGSGVTLSWGCARAVAELATVDARPGATLSP